MTKDEALKLALSTLDEVRSETFRLMRNGQTLYAEEKVWSTITAIKKALAQPIIESYLEKDNLQPEQKRPQNCGTGYCSCIECVMKPSPRAWLIEFENGDEELHFDEQSVGEIHVPLYTTPPKREWVELTNEQRSDLVTLHHGWNEYGQAIEAELRSKNT